MPDTPAISWFSSQAAYDAAVLPGLELRRERERAIARQPEADGYCLVCRAPARFAVPSGSFFADQPDLREGWRCLACQCTNRQRLLLHAVREVLRDVARPRVYLAEAFSQLAIAVRQESWRLTLSDYVDPHLASGTHTVVSGHPVVHQDLTATDLPARRFHAVVHAEVLEHVPDWQGLLRETARLTRAGGWTVFTVPFLARNGETLVRAVEGSTGPTHVLEPEVHGAPLHPEGVLVYQVPGWDLLDGLREAGFSSPEVGWLNDPRCGITSNNSDFDNFMEPLVVRARRM